MSDNIPYDTRPWAVAPKRVTTYEELKAFRAEYADSIIVAIDFEAVDHLDHLEYEFAYSAYEKASELGVAVFEPRVTPYDQNSFTQLAQKIEGNHVVITEWSLFTEETCPRRHAPHNPRRRHVARPYHSQFAASTSKSLDESLLWLDELFKKLVLQNRTDEEVASGKQRSIKVLFWDYRLEESIVAHPWNPTYPYKQYKEKDRPIDYNHWFANQFQDVELWDLQVWSAIQDRFWKEPCFDDEGYRKWPRKNCGEAMATLGILAGDEEAIREGREQGIVFHNALNDAVVQILSWNLFMKMTKDEWNEWFEKEKSLPPIDLSWIDPEIYRANYAAGREQIDNWRPPTPPPPPSPRTSEEIREAYSKIVAERYASMPCDGCWNSSEDWSGGWESSGWNTDGKPTSWRARLVESPRRTCNWLKKKFREKIRPK